MAFKHIAALGAVLVSSVAISPSAFAATVVVANYSFESPALSPNSYQSNGEDITGWTRYPTGQGLISAGVQNFSDANYFRPSDGNQVVYINAGTIGQDLGALLPNTTYTLTVAVGNQPNYGRGSTGAFGFYGSNNQEYSSAVANPLPYDGSMTDFMTSFTTLSSVSGDLFVRLSNRSGDQVLYDNVRVNAVSTVAAAVPEPATWAMMILGIGVVGFSMRRRQRVVFNAQSAI